MNKLHVITHHNNTFQSSCYSTFENSTSAKYLTLNLLCSTIQHFTLELPVLIWFLNSGILKIGIVSRYSNPCIELYLICHVENHFENASAKFKGTYLLSLYQWSLSYLIIFIIFYFTFKMFSSSHIHHLQYSTT